MVIDESQGWGVVQFSSPVDAQTAINVRMGGELQGCHGAPLAGGDIECCCAFVGAEWQRV